MCHREALYFKLLVQCAVRHAGMVGRTKRAATEGLTMAWTPTGLRLGDAGQAAKPFVADALGRAPATSKEAANRSAGRLIEMRRVE